MANARSCPMVVWWVYVMACEGGILYVGISPDPLRRFVDHQARKSRFSQMRRPVELLACLALGPYKLAVGQERWLKRQSPQRKLQWVNLVRSGSSWNALVALHGSEAFVAKVTSILMLPLVV